MGKFQTEQLAARFLLTHATNVLVDCGVDFVIVGGWVPFLFHATRFGHPGTYDVDVLLNSSSLDDGSFDQASSRLLDGGYLRAVKNKFQAHRILNVAGEDLVFHLDFLNERAPGNALQLVGGKGRLQSIYTEAMQAIFRYGNYRTVNELPGVRFPSIESFIVTKAAAAKVKKRRRDAFDVFVSVLDAPDGLTKRWSRLVESDGLFRDANDALCDAVTDGEAIQKTQSILQDLAASHAFNGQIPSEDEIRQAFRFLVEPGDNLR